MKNLFTFSSLYSFLLLIACSGVDRDNFKIGEDSKVNQHISMEVFQMKEKEEAIKAFETLSYPFVLEGQLRVRRSFNQGKRIVIITTCIDESLSQKSQREFSGLSDAEKRRWFNNAQSSGMLGWAIGGELDGSIGVSQYIEKDNNSNTSSERHLLTDKNTKVEIQENQCALFQIDSIKEPFQSEFPVNHIGQVLVVSILEGKG